VVFRCSFCFRFVFCFGYFVGTGTDKRNVWEKKTNAKAENENGEVQFAEQKQTKRRITWRFGEVIKIRLQKKRKREREREKIVATTFFWNREKKNRRAMNTTAVIHVLQVFSTIPLFGVWALVLLFLMLLVWKQSSRWAATWVVAPLLVLSLAFFSFSNYEKLNPVSNPPENQQQKSTSIVFKLVQTLIGHSQNVINVKL